MSSKPTSRSGTAPDRWGIALALGFLAVATVSVLYLAFVALPAGRAEAMDEWSHRLVNTSDDRRTAVRTWVEDLRADARTLAGYPTGRYLLEGRTGPPYPFDIALGPEQHLRALYGQFVGIHGRAFAALYDTAGTRRVRGGGAVPDSDSTLLSMIGGAIDGTSSIDLVGGLVAVAVPVVGDTAGYVGAVVVGTDASPFLFRLLRSEPVQSRTGETFLVSRRGDGVVYVSPLRKVDVRPGELSLPEAARRLAGAAAARGEAGLDEFVDYRGAEVLAAMTPIAGTPWALVAKVDMAEVMAEFRSEVARLVLAVMGLLVGALGVAFGAWRWQRQRLAHSQQVLEQQLHQAQKMEAVGRLAGGVAHDFNNILTTIQGHAALVLEEIEAGHPIADGIEEIRQAAERATSLTRQLLTFSRQEPLQKSPVDVGRIVRRLEQMLQRLIGEHITLHVSASEDEALMVLADATRIEQVVLNLAVNARDAMPDGGRIDIDVRMVSGAALGPSGGARGDRAIQLTVTDTGIGMDPETEAHIFEPFFTTKGEEHGTGLGLATVYGIVEQAGGTIEVETEPGHGTRFTVCFPALPPGMEGAQASPSPGGAVATPGPSRGTILLVEDEHGVRELARRVLERQGHRVLVARSGTEALDQVQQSDASLDLVVMDLVMPDLDGRDLARRIREDQPGCPILLMSGYSEDAVARQVTLRAPAAFIEKPFTPEELVRRVDEALSGHFSDDEEASS